MGTDFTLREFNEFAKKSLENIYTLKEIESIIHIILEKKLNLTKIDVLLNKNYRFSQREIDELYQIVDELKKQKPIQYIMGETEFFDLTFRLNEHVLIPRQETEELVDWIVKECKGYSLRILDIGTGTGCIAIALAMFLPESTVEGVDIDERIIRLAQENSRRNGVKARFFNLNILKDDLPGGYDLIVSNPPYVRESEKEYMHGNVLKFEPEEALFVTDEDPLIFYREIIKKSVKSLNSEGMLFMEINEYLGEEIQTLLEDNGFKDVVLKKDINDKPRMIKGTRR
jgi:release factor glutamine methyltransferase